MADAAEASPVAPKEKKKKKSVKASEKSKAAAPTTGAAPPAEAAPHQNGGAPAPTIPVVNIEEAPAVNGEAKAPEAVNGVEAEASVSLKKRPSKSKISVETDVETSEPPPETPASASKPRPKFSWSVQADDVSAEEETTSVAVQMQIPVPTKKSVTPEPQPPTPREASPEPKVEGKPELTDLDEEKMRELAEAFILLDFNQDGLIDKKDLQMTYATLGRVDIPESEIQQMLDEGESPMDFEAFAALLGFKTVELDTEETLLRALAQWDNDNSGLIPEERLRHDLMTWGDKFSPQEVTWALEDAPMYSQGSATMIDYVQFCKTLCGLRKKTK